MGKKPFEASGLRALAASLDDRRLIHDGVATSVLRELVTIGRDLASALADDIERMADGYFQKM